MNKLLLHLRELEDDSDGNLFTKSHLVIIIYVTNNEGKNITPNFDNDKQPLNILVILVALNVFHLDISGKFDNDEQPEKISFISLTLIVFHFDISGKLDNDEHPQNIYEKLFISFVSKYFNSSIFFNDLHS